MPRKPASTLLIAIVLAAALALAGCGSSSDETTGGNGGGGGAESTAAEPSTDASPSTDAKPAKEDTSPPASGSGALHGVATRACGSAAGGLIEIRATGINCAAGRKLATSWAASESCTIPKGASRGSCRIANTICLSVVSGRGLAVSCARPNQAVAFIARR